MTTAPHTARNPMARKKKKDEPKVPLFVQLDAEIAAAFSEYLDATDPKVGKTAAVESALKDFLRGKGYWPRKEGA